MTEKIFIKAEIQGVLPSGQKVVHLLANNADGIVFCTDDKSIVIPQDLTTKAVQKFAERLKEHYIKDKRYDRPEAHTRVDFLFALIDSLVKEKVI